jgi:probable H4MPT-linked C1 transfer pathway protein
VKTPVVGWDIGGANVKAARLDGKGVAPVVVERPFEVWREPGRLADVLAEIAQRLGPARSAGITMTAELADCFADRRSGVLAVLDAVEQALPDVSLRIFGTDGRFHPLPAARRNPERSASANWLAAARRLAYERSSALLVDTGSTTTDIVPIARGEVVARGRTDLERLRTGELVYTGALRTPACAAVRRVALAEGWCPVAAEHFAIAADANLWLGRIGPESYTCRTPDGRGTGRAETGARLARMVCAEADTLGDAGITRIAREIVGAQRRQIAAALRQVVRSLGALAPRRAVVAGSGERLAAEAARAAGLRPERLAELWGEDAARAAPAAAVAWLIAELHA